jgi:hypothetical protein
MVHRTNVAVTIWRIQVRLFENTASLLLFVGTQALAIGVILAI